MMFRARLGLRNRVGKFAREGAVLVSNPILEHAVVQTGQHRSQGINSYCSIGRTVLSLRATTPPSPINNLQEPS
jgi:hypothetical protein